MKNNHVLGYSNFLKEFKKDLDNKVATGWWNELYARRQDVVNVVLHDKTFKTTFSLTEYVKENSDKISEEEFNKVIEDINNGSYILTRRTYLWEYEEQSEKEEAKQETNQAEESNEDADESEELVEDESEAQESNIEEPDFEYAKSLEDDKQALKAYAKEWGFKLDARKEFSDMLKSFKGKYHASKK